MPTLSVGGIQWHSGCSSHGTNPNSPTNK